MRMVSHQYHISNIDTVRPSPGHQCTHDIVELGLAGRPLHTPLTARGKNMTGPSIVGRGTSSVALDGLVPTAWLT